MIPYGRQTITQADIDAVEEVLRSDFLTQGPMVPRFEELISGYCGAHFGVAVNSATSALHIACAAMGLGKGDMLWTSPNTFVASANCALYCGASVDFVDIDFRTYNISPDALEVKLIEAKKTHNLPKILVAVHFAGQPCDMQRIHALSLEYGFKIIEDASHAIGGKYQGEPIGNCKFSDVTVFSFHPVKIITTAEGGMAMTNDETFAKKLRQLRSHGITRNQAEMESESEGLWYYQQVDLGWNYRLTDLQAALGIEQFKRLDEYVANRHALAKRYDQLLAKLPLQLPYNIPNAYSGLHLYPVRIDLTKIKKSRKQVFREMRERGIGVNVHYIPVHLQPHYRKLGFNAGDFPQAENYYAEEISLPLYADLSFQDQDKVVAALSAILAKNENKSG
jgi:UDP-4-amino-4,6-dideoxy-N-acetyl-beta-L-altrosamine transaminase